MGKKQRCTKENCGKALRKFAGYAGDDGPFCLSCATFVSHLTGKPLKKCLIKNVSGRVHVDIEVKSANGFALSEEHAFNCSKELFVQEFETILLDFIDSETDSELIIRKVRGPEELE